MSQLVNVKRVLEILNFVKNKELFLEELFAAISKSTRENNQKIIENCIEEWEASAELNSIPNLASNVQKRYRLLVKAGLIDAK